MVPIRSSAAYRDRLKRGAVGSDLGDAKPISDAGKNKGGFQTTLPERLDSGLRFDAMQKPAVLPKGGGVFCLTACWIATRAKCTPRRPTESAKMVGVRAYQPSQSQSCGCPTVALGESDRGWATWCSGGPTQLAGDWLPTLPAPRGASAGPLHPVASTGVLIGPLRTSAETGCWAAINGAPPGEYSLSGIVVGELVNVRIDRTFIDENGTLWIIDYKSRSHGGSAVEAFPDN